MALEKKVGNRDNEKAVRRMRDWIDLHLTEPISLYELAQVAGYSPFHAGRIFKDVTGKTPFEYIREARLSKAAALLRGSNMRVTDVAFDFVFDSLEGFTRAFSKQFGTNPRRYRQHEEWRNPVQPSPPNDQTKQPKGGVEMSKLCVNNTIFVQVVDRPRRKLILKRGKAAADYYRYCEEVGCEVWNELTKIADALYEPFGMWLPKNMVPPGTSIYAQGVEVSEDFKGHVPAGFEIISLPACKMMVFQGPPYDDARFEEAIGDLWDLLKIYDPKIYGFEWADEDAPRFQLEPQGYRGYIEARPVRQLNSNPS